jgi:hypothetical protein
MATLYYWPIRGRAEVVRLLCAEAQVELKEEVPQDFKVRVVCIWLELSNVCWNTHLHG